MLGDEMAGVGSRFVWAGESCHSHPTVTCIIITKEIHTKGTDSTTYINFDGVSTPERMLSRVIEFENRCSVPLTIPLVCHYVLLSHRKPQDESRRQCTIYCNVGFLGNISHITLLPV